MNKEQVFEVLSLISAAYPKFDFDQNKLNTWHRLLKDQNPEVIIRNTERYVLENRFPPSIADLREKKHEAYSTNIMDQIREWEKHAARK
ncbi:hypothetical protein HMPREF3291_05175 [Bacillus sp. HMSC76G11]|nr:hypothetical protein HMPREF3291_05175 [Bacillus sp. HMSC76G11]